MKKLLIYFSIIMLLSISFISAVPQIVTTHFNLTVSSSLNGNLTNGNVLVFGEGGQMNNAFAVEGNCSFNYTLNNIPFVFSRDFQQNETDMAILIHSLTILNNMSANWQECTINLSTCMNDVGYKGNYTQAVAQLDICYRARDASAAQAITLTDQIAGLTTWRTIGFAAGVIGIGAAIYLFRKQSIKKADNPYRSVSVGAVQH